MFRGCGRGGSHGRGRGLMDDRDAQQLGIHFHEAIALPLGDRTRGSIPNVVSFICYFHIVLLTYNAASINSKFAHIQCSLSTLLDGFKMLLKVWVVLLLWLDKSLFGNRMSKGYILLFKYLFDI